MSGSHLDTYGYDFSVGIDLGGINRSVGLLDWTDDIINIMAVGKGKGAKDMTDVTHEYIIQGMYGRSFQHLSHLSMISQTNLKPRESCRWL